jgi:hypothetical protein
MGPDDEIEIRAHAYRVELTIRNYLDPITMGRETKLLMTKEEVTMLIDNLQKAIDSIGNMRDHRASEDE